MPKKACECTVISVDGEKDEAAHWICKCFEESSFRHRMASAKRVDWRLWSPLTGGGSKPNGNPYGQATDPENGDAFEVEYKCNCSDIV